PTQARVAHTAPRPRVALVLLLPGEHRWTARTTPARIRPGPSCRGRRGSDDHRVRTPERTVGRDRSARLAYLRGRGRHLPRTRRPGLGSRPGADRPAPAGSGDTAR